MNFGKRKSLLQDKTPEKVEDVDDDNTSIVPDSLWILSMLKREKESFV